MPPTDSKKNWFITGGSSGLGLEMALAALHAGHRVIGTGRNINAAAKSCPEFEKLGGEWLQLDVSQQDAQQAVEDFLAGEQKQQNQHWVIVNNAGSSLIGSVEDMSSAQVAAYMQANLHGPIRIWKACLPLLRRNRTGTLITISSVWGFVPKSEHMLYSAAKAALESLTESYADLLGPLGIRVMIVEPGGFRTGFPGNAGRSDLGVTRDYRERIGAWMRVLDEASRDETVVNGDPGLFGERVLDAVDGRGAFKKLWEAQEMGRVLRVPLGSDCYGLLGQRLKELVEAYAGMAEIAKSTDVANE